MRTTQRFGSNWWLGPIVCLAISAGCATKLPPATFDGRDCVIAVLTEEQAQRMHRLLGASCNAGHKTKDGDLVIARWCADQYIEDQVNAIRALTNRADTHP